MSEHVIKYVRGSTPRSETRPGWLYDSPVDNGPLGFVLLLPCMGGCLMLVLGIVISMINISVPHDDLRR
jgi:hypothetical protein